MNHTVRRGLGYGIPIAWVAVLLAFSGSLGPVARFLGATVCLLLSIKVGAWILVPDRSLSPGETLLFWTAWPGVRPDRFVSPGEYATPEGRTFVEGYAHVLAGLVLGVLALLAVPAVGTGIASWLLIFAVLSVVHFGIGRILPFCLRWLGYPVEPLFEDPVRSRGVGDFWSRRWNRPFVGMNRLFVTEPLSSRAGMGLAAALAFLVSGVLHELAISYPAGAGWGGPMLYFVVQAALYTVEQRWFPDHDRPLLGRAWTYAAVLVPLPLLFHAPFRATFVVPLVEVGGSALLARPLAAYLGAGLWAGAAGHFLVLVASARVPAELDWATDLESLKPLNRKILWTYGGFIVLTIVSFGVLTAAFHAQFLAGTPVALGVCGMIATFWTARILVDAFYYSHDDWPEGVEYVVGHALLTSLFLFLVLVYGGTIAVHVL